jgi:GntR family transcriptional regulator
MIMLFRETQPIYLQIADYVCEKILLKDWLAEQRIPSVRELAVSLEVNPNTVMRAYEFLQQKEIIINERGVGLFVGSKALRNARLYLQEALLEKELPGLFRMLALLDTDIDELKPAFEKFMRKNYKHLKRQPDENQ